MQPGLFFQQLSKQLQNQLPGSLSHSKMLPPGRLLQLPSGLYHFRESAVLMLLFPDGKGIKICLIRRPSTMKNHAGQIAFPGGKREGNDMDLIQTALREAKEEIGIARDAVVVAGVLSPVFVQVSDFVITPVVGWMNEKPSFSKDPHEVDEIILLSLEDIFREANLCSREMETTTGPTCAPGYEIDGIFIWGATAMMLAELKDVAEENLQL